MNHSKVKAIAIDNAKNKIIYAGAALLIVLLAAALFSGTASAQTAVAQDEQVQNTTAKINKIECEWTPHLQIHDKINVPFQLKSQKLSQ